MEICLKGSHVELGAQGVAVIWAKAPGRLYVEVGLEAVHKRAHRVACMAHMHNVSRVLPHCDNMAAISGSDMLMHSHDVREDLQFEGFSFAWWRKFQDRASQRVAIDCLLQST